MTVEQTTSDTRRARWFSYAWHPIVIWLFLLAAQIRATVLAQRTNVGGPIHGDISDEMLVIGIIAVALFLVEAVGFIIVLRRRDWARAAWQGLAIAILVYPSGQFRWAAQLTDLFLFPSVFVACEQNAQPYDDDGKFAICNAQSWGDDVYDVIVYDSGGEISRPEPQQSQSFRALIKAQIPLLSQCRIFPSWRLCGAFYLVDTVCDQ